MLLKILTYNIHGLPWCGTNIEAIAEWIFRDSGASIICLQESFSMDQRHIFQAAAHARRWTAHFPQDRCWLGSCLRGLECGSGLSIFTHPSIRVNGIPVFEAFHGSAGVDALVKKGFFRIHCRLGDYDFHVINTHLQSDMTDIPNIRINYPEVREGQQIQLYVAASKLQNVFLTGDMNMQTFKWFIRPDPRHHITFPETGEHLDHLLMLARERNNVQHIETEYFDEAPWSDHIPVLFSIKIQGKK